MDEGAESLLARVPEAVALADAVGLGDELVAPATTAAAVWTRGRMRPLPTGTVMGVPADLRALGRSGVLSARGLARVPLDRVLPGGAVTGDAAAGDRSVADVVGGRLGAEVVERLVEPLLGGVYAGRADELSFAATLPQLAAAGRDTRSLLAAARVAQARSSGARTGPVFLTVPAGLGRLAIRVAAAADAECLLGRPVRELTRTPDGWRLVIGPTPEPEVLAADAVVLAVPARPAARLLTGVAADAAAELAGIDYASVAVVTLAWPAADFAAPVPGSGFLVPAADGRLVKAATFSSVKWPHLAAADPTLAVVRGSVGRHRDEAVLQRDDVELAGLVAADLRSATGVRGRPVAWRVTRWGGGLPQYAVGHLDRVRRIRAAVERQPGLEICGAAYDGVGVAACIRSANSAAAGIVDFLAKPPPAGG